MYHTAKYNNINQFFLNAYSYAYAYAYVYTNFLHGPNDRLCQIVIPCS